MRRGSIPAWAGETDDRTYKWRMQAVYPRVGGGNNPMEKKLVQREGLSPRGRGKHTAVHYNCD